MEAVKEKAKPAAPSEKHGDTRTRKGKWKRGVSGNPGGRPRGARSCISQQLADDVIESWRNIGGVEWLERLAVSDKRAYAALVSKLLPKEMNVNIDGKMSWADVVQLSVADRLSGAN